MYTWDREEANQWKAWRSQGEEPNEQVVTATVGGVTEVIDPWEKTYERKMLRFSFLVVGKGMLEKDVPASSKDKFAGMTSDLLDALGIIGSFELEDFVGIPVKLTIKQSMRTGKGAYAGQVFYDLKIAKIEGLMQTAQTPQMPSYAPQAPTQMPTQMPTQAPAPTGAPAPAPKPSKEEHLGANEVGFNLDDDVPF